MKNRWVLSFILFVAIPLAGCEKISSFFDYFAPKSKNANPQVSAVNTALDPAATGQGSNVPASQEDVLASIGDWTLTLDEFNQRLENLKTVIPEFDTSDAESKKLLLEEIIRQQLLVLDAEQSGILKNKDIVEAVEEFRRTLLVREVVLKITQGIKISEEEARTFYTEHKSEFVGPAEWHIREIVVDSQDQASQILKDILGGADFSESAKQYSKSASAADGGDLGFISNPNFPQMENVLLTLEVGGVSGVFKGPGGFYLIKLEEKKGGESREFNEIKDEIIEGLTLMKQQQVILDYISGLQQKVPVKINEQLLIKQ